MSAYMKKSPGKSFWGEKDHYEGDTGKKVEGLRQNQNTV